MSIVTRWFCLLVGIGLVAGQMQPASAQERVGVASAVDQSAQSQLGGGPLKTIRIGKDVFHSERIRTGGEGRVQVLLADGSNFMVGPNSSLTIDEFVYRPREGQGKLIATFGRGVARYVGGKISKSRGGVTINTRQGTIGIRGGMADLFDRGGTTVYSFLYGKGLTFRVPSGKSYRVYRPGFAIFPDGNGARVGRTPASVVAAINRFLTGSARGQKRPTAGQIGRLSGINSGVSPVPGQPIPGPVIVSGDGEVPGRLLDLGFANSSVLKSNKTICYYGC
ncbi:FecR domain-containing protein [Stappia sp. ES.058]|uniref:FecR family protein n=1 Tax=Stappia sp. ES.058 TaxID=1881061 RepID=UPI0008792964|nr:FecR domain-containing protein [Stappia sp. ES.058]SDT95191.1 FecR family protein [Stappia sp. ES.058]